MQYVSFWIAQCIPLCCKFCWDSQEVGKTVTATYPSVQMTAYVMKHPRHCREQWSLHRFPRSVPEVNISIIGITKVPWGRKPCIVVQEGFLCLLSAFLTSRPCSGLINCPAFIVMSVTVRLAGCRAKLNHSRGALIALWWAPLVCFYYYLFIYLLPLPHVSTQSSQEGVRPRSHCPAYTENAFLCS